MSVEPCDIVRAQRRAVLAENRCTRAVVDVAGTGVDRHHVCCCQRLTSAAGDRLARTVDKVSVFVHAHRAVTGPGLARRTVPAAVGSCSVRISAYVSTAAIAAAVTAETTSAHQHRRGGHTAPAGNALAQCSGLARVHTAGRLGIHEFVDQPGYRLIHAVEQRPPDLERHHCEDDQAQ